MQSRPFGVISVGSLVDSHAFDNRPILFAMFLECELILFCFYLKISVNYYGGSLDLILMDRESSL